MEKTKNLFFVAIEGILFGNLGGLFAFISLYLLYYFTYQPPSGSLCILTTPNYKIINFPFVITFLTISFWSGKIIFKLLKTRNLQWFYNVIFFIVSTTLIQMYVVLIRIQSMNYEFSFENIMSMSYLQLNALIIILSIFYSIFFQIIKTRILVKPKTIM